MGPEFTGGLGGPGEGGHNSDWFIEFGMDLGAPSGAEVRASFDGHVSVYHRHDRAADSVNKRPLVMSSAATPRRPRWRSSQRHSGLAPAIIAASIDENVTVQGSLRLIPARTAPHRSKGSRARG